MKINEYNKLINNIEKAMDILTETKQMLESEKPQPARILDKEKVSLKKVIE